MEMLRESKAREKEDGVDPNAFIVDRNQFFNTQVTTRTLVLYASSSFPSILALLLYYKKNERF